MRCLQVQARTLERVAAADERSGAETRFVPTDELEAGGSRLVPWDEALEHEIDLPELALLPLAAASAQVEFVLPAARDTELVRDTHDCVIGRVTRVREEVRGRVRACAFWAEGPADLLQLAVTVENTTDWFEPGSTREVVTRHSIVAAHTMLAIEGGRFVSLLDPPADAAGAVAGCTNAGAFPVLVGAPGATDLVLSSPIILYDYPAIAPESPGDLYDSTEIDEILALRVLTLTDDEKAEARATDRRAAAIVDRCDAMDTADFAHLHGTMRPFSFNAPAPEPAATRAARARAAMVGPGCRRVGRSRCRRGAHCRHRCAQGNVGSPPPRPPGRRARHVPRRAHGHGRRGVPRCRRQRPCRGDAGRRPRGRGLRVAEAVLVLRARRDRTAAPLRVDAMTRTLVAGIGNIFFGDDGFGVAVAERLAREPMPAGARVEDFGIRGVHLAYELLDGYDALVLVDAIALDGDPPGTLALLEIDGPDRSGAPTDLVTPVVDAHTMSPDVVLGLLAGLGGTVGRVYVVGCQPETLDDGIGLSASVAASVDAAARMVHDLLADVDAVETDAPNLTVKEGIRT